MKKQLLTIFLSAIFFCGFSQSDDVFWTFSGYQYSNGNTKVDGLEKSSLGSFNHFLGRMDVVDYASGLTGYADGSYLIGGLAGGGLTGSMPSVLGSILEMGYGFSLNNGNVIQLSSNVEAQITLGFCAGYRAYYTPSANKISGGILLGPEIGSIISLGDNMVLAPKVGISPLINKGFIGNRKVFEVNYMVKLLPWFGLSVTPSLESYSYKATDVALKSKTSFSSIRLGLSILNL